MTYLFGKELGYVLDLSLNDMMVHKKIEILYLL
jgi:hypothetical protein